MGTMVGDMDSIRCSRQRNAGTQARRIHSNLRTEYRCTEGVPETSLQYLTCRLIITPDCTTIINTCFIIFIQLSLTFFCHFTLLRNFGWKRECHLSHCLVFYALPCVQGVCRAV